MFCLLTQTVGFTSEQQELKELKPELYKLRLDLSKETIYELVSTQEGMGWSLAIADIVETVPHFHNYTSETYTLVTGILEVTIEGKNFCLFPGDVIQIPLKAIHSAKSLTDTPARILVSCVPGWTVEDHIYINN